MDDALNRKMHAMHVATTIVFPSYLIQHIIQYIARDEQYVQIKENLQQPNLEKRYEGYHVADNGPLIYKIRMYILNVADLRKNIMDEIYKILFFNHPRYQQMIAS